MQYVYDLQYLKNQANLKACFVSCVHAFKKAATTPDIVIIVSFDVKTIYSQLILFFIDFCCQWLHIEKQYSVLYVCKSWKQASPKNLLKWPIAWRTPT